MAAYKKVLSMRLISSLDLPLKHQVITSNETIWTGNRGRNPWNTDATVSSISLGSSSNCHRLSVANDPVRMHEPFNQISMLRRMAPTSKFRAPQCLRLHLGRLISD